MPDSPAENSISHPLIETVDLPSGRTLFRIQKEATLKVFREDEDTGYHDYGTQWWTNPECPYAFKYLALDALYEPTYFDESRGHPSYARSKELYAYMQSVSVDLFGRRFSSILELGTGGGEITRHFHEDGLDFVAVEGTTAGVEKLLSLGIPRERILQRNLKFLERLERKFDIAMCTEVAEHIEPWFASKVVSNCVEHADVVWFSAAKGDAPPHYHHINEVPIQAWDNLFAHFGFNCFVELNGTMGRADRIYLNEKLVAPDSA